MHSAKVEKIRADMDASPSWEPEDEASTDLSGEAIGPTPPAFSDEALALRFAERHRHDLRYVAAWGRWLSWGGNRWQFDDTLAAFDRARKICREAAAECNKDRIASTLASAKTVAAVVSLARADRRLAGTVDQWDCDPWLLNTPAGVIDLQTGERHPHCPDKFFTKITAAPPAGDCPRWCEFLDRVTNGSSELQGFLQRLVGYGLTGSTREHALFFLHGVGANGKSVFINTVSGLLAEYHRSAPIETFTASSGERHPTDLAGLRGARLVTAVETEEGRRWAESRIKTLTGGDTIAARFMRQDYFEFVPQFKLLIAGNHKPGLRSIDEAIRRRFHMIPFSVTIPEAERDMQLGERLRAEWPGILQWAIDGCLAWQQTGLAPPAIVQDATNAYLESEDAVAAWLEDCCERDHRGWEPTSKLFGSWKVWADRAGEYAGSQKRFKEQLETRGFGFSRRGSGNGYSGVSLKVVPQEEAYRNR